MTRDEAIKIIKSADITQEEKDELIGKLKNQDVTEEEAQAVAAALDKSIADIDKQAVATIETEAQKEIDAAGADYEKTMKELDKEATQTFNQAADYLDKMTAEELQKKASE